MKNLIKKIGYIIFVILCISIGLYPAVYFMADMSSGLLGSKSPELLGNAIWNTAFYGHIIFGGVALLGGWPQFLSKLRKKHLSLHRRLGLLYFSAVMISGFCGIYIGFYTTGGWISSSGFILLGILWVSTTLKAFTAIRNKQPGKHQKYMIYSYALCFAAVTLRLWLPTLSAAFGAFIPAYRLVAWLCWVPNLLVAHFLTRKIPASAWNTGSA